MSRPIPCQNVSPLEIKTLNAQTSRVRFVNFIFRTEAASLSPDSACVMA